MLGQHVRLFLFAGRRLHRHAGLARDDMNVQVEHHLAAGALVELLDGDAVGRKRLHRRLGDLLRDVDHMGEIVGADVEDVAGRGLRQHQRVPRRARHDVEEGEDLVVLVDFVAGQLAAQDLGKDVVWIVARHRLPRSSSSRLRPIAPVLFDQILAEWGAAASSSAAACT